jgi:hypothetical protein
MSLRKYLPLKDICRENVQINYEEKIEKKKLSNIAICYFRKSISLKKRFPGSEENGSIYK